MQCTQTRLNTNQWPIPHGWLFMTTMGSIHVLYNYVDVYLKIYLSTSQKKKKKKKKTAFRI